MGNFQKKCRMRGPAVLRRCQSTTLGWNKQMGESSTSQCRHIRLELGGSETQAGASSRTPDPWAMLSDLGDRDSTLRTFSSWSWDLCSALAIPLGEAFGLLVLGNGLLGFRNNVFLAGRGRHLHSGRHAALVSLDCGSKGRAWLGGALPWEGRAQSSTALARSHSPAPFLVWLCV